jgi:hypothetical protein
MVKNSFGLSSFSFFTVLYPGIFGLQYCLPGKPLHTRKVLILTKLSRTQKQPLNATLEKMH